MRAAIDRVDVVGKAEHRLGVAVVVLHCDFNFNVVALRFHHDRLLVQHRLAAIEMLDELRDAAGVAELSAPRLASLSIRGALIGQRDFESFVQEGKFAQSLSQRVIVVFGRREDGFVGQKVDLGAAPLRGTSHPQFTGGCAAAEIHFPGMAVAPYFHIQFLAESIHAAHADAMQSTGHFVVRGVELSACVEFGQHHLNGRHRLAVRKCLHINGDTTTVVDDSDGVVHVDGNVDFLGITGKGFVNGVVYYFVNKMVKTHFTGRADVHGRTKSYVLHALKDGNVFACVVSVVAGRGIQVAWFSRHNFPFAESSPSVVSNTVQPRRRSRSRNWGLTA